jgi:hypothetical protein
MSMVADCFDSCVNGSSHERHISNAKIWSNVTNRNPFVVFMATPFLCGSLDPDSPDPELFWKQGWLLLPAFLQPDLFLVF